MNWKLKLMIKNIQILLPLTILAYMGSSCSSDPNSPGVEYMPDMYRSPAIEAYVDYPMERDDSRNKKMSARKPVKGTIAFSFDEKKAYVNFPYGYANTNEGYDSAGRFLTKNPVLLTPESLAQGKDLFVKYCSHCHGANGKGDGQLVKNGNYPPIPAYDGPLKSLPIGKMFHTLVYGKNNMGSHASQLNKEERWAIIHYIQVLQNGGKDPFEKKDEANVESDESES